MFLVAFERNWRALSRKGIGSFCLLSQFYQEIIFLGNGIFEGNIKRKTIDSSVAGVKSLLQRQNGVWVYLKN